MLLFVALSFAGQYAKYNSFGYNGLDLGIYAQVFSESAHGRLFHFTIHPHSYLGDHVELLIVGLLPVYWLCQSPLTLLLLQSLALGLGAWPLYQFCRRRLNERWSLGVSLAYLLSPFVWNINFYEFHLLPFAIPLLFFAILEYDRRRFKTFLVWIILALLVREDVALAVFGFGLLAWWERRPWRWRLLPMLFGAIWFFCALKIAAVSGNLGSYKFLKYYAWLGPDLMSIVANFFGHPWLVVQKLFRLTNVVFLIGLGLPFAFLFLRAGRWLIPYLALLLQLGLSGYAGDVALKIHYPSLFLPFLMTGAVVGLASLLNGQSRMSFIRFFARERGLTAAVLCAVTLASSLVMGTAPGVFRHSLPSAVEQERRQLKRDVASLVGADTPLAAGYSFIGRLAQRPVLASLHYLYIGTEQYSDRPYLVPDQVAAVLVDQSDFLIYHVVYPENKLKYQTGADRYRALLSDRQLNLQFALDDYLLYAQAPATDSFRPVQGLVDLPAERHGDAIPLEGPLQSLGWAGVKPGGGLALQSVELHSRRYAVLPITFYWRQAEPTDHYNEFTFQLIGRSGQKYSKRYPLAPLGPQSGWSAEDIVSTSYRFLVPKTFLNEPFQAEIIVSDSTGWLGLDGWQSIEPKYAADKVLGVIPLGTIDPRAF